MATIHRRLNMAFHRNASVVLILFASNHIGFCSQSKMTPLAKKAQVVKRIHIKGGIDRAHAILEIDLYLDYVVQAHCMPTEILDGGDSWYCVPNVGDDCTPDAHRIQVDKKSGAISWGLGPKYASPAVFGSEVIRNPKGPVSASGVTN